MVASIFTLSRPLQAYPLRTLMYEQRNETRASLFPRHDFRGFSRPLSRLGGLFYLHHCSWTICACRQDQLYHQCISSVQIRKAAVLMCICLQCFPSREEIGYIQGSDMCECVDVAISVIHGKNSAVRIATKFLSQIIRYNDRNYCIFVEKYYARYSSLQNERDYSSAFCTYMSSRSSRIYYSLIIFYNNLHCIFSVIQLH